MKIKNNSERNVSVRATHPTNGSEGLRILLPATATLELDDLDYDKVSSELQLLVEADVLTIIEQAVTPLTNEQIIKRVFDETEITLPKKLKKSELQAKAALLGVKL